MTNQDSKVNPEIYQRMLRPLRDRYGDRPPATEYGPVANGGYVALRWEILNPDVDKPTFRPKELAAMLKEQRLIWLLGAPYSGKTYTIWELLQSGLLDQKLQPVYLPLAYARFDEGITSLYGLARIAHPHLDVGQGVFTNPPYLLILDDAQLANPCEGWRLIYDLIRNHLHNNVQDRVIAILHRRADEYTTCEGIESKEVRLDGFPRSGEGRGRSYKTPYGDLLNSHKQRVRLENIHEDESWWPMFVDRCHGVSSINPNLIDLMLQGPISFYRTLLHAGNRDIPNYYTDTTTIEQTLRSVARNILNGEGDWTKDLGTLNGKKGDTMYEFVIKPDVQQRFPFFTPSMLLHFIALEAGIKIMAYDGEQLAQPAAGATPQDPALPEAMTAIQNPTIWWLFFTQLIGVLRELLLANHDSRKCTDVADLLAAPTHRISNYSLADEVERLRSWCKSSSRLGRLATTTHIEHNYGGVTGSVNSGSGEQTNTTSTQDNADDEK